MVLTSSSVISSIWSTTAATARDLRWVIISVLIGTFRRSNHFFNTGGYVGAEKQSGQDIWGSRLHSNAVIDDNDVTSVAASANLDYDVLDLVLSRRFRMSNYAKTNFTLFGGFRYAKIDQTFNINYTQQLTATSTRTVDISSPTPP